MSYEQEFDVTVNGIDFHVYTSANSFSVTTNNGLLTITDQFGDCNPLSSLWNDYRYSALHGAAQKAMELKCIKDAVAEEVELHKLSCLELVEEDLAGEEAAARELVERRRVLK